MPIQGRAGGDPAPTDEGTAFLNEYGYRHDLFVSYSHGDIEGTGDSLLAHWSVEFVHGLHKFLVGILEEPVSIFLDVSKNPATAVNPMAPLDEELTAALDHAALLQILMTPAYLKSSWCARELTHWTAGQPKKRGSPQNRIAVARVWGTKDRPWPPALKDQSKNDLPGFTFHDRQDQMPWGYGGGLRYTGRRPVPPNDRFLDEIRKLAIYLTKRLIELKTEIKQQKAAQEEVRQLQAGNATIYLYARQEHGNFWQSTSDVLKGLGLQVLPGEPEPPDADDDERQRKDLARIASRCQAMLLVGVDGLALDADLDVIGYDRRNFVRSLYQKALPCAVVDRTGTLGTEERQSRASKFQIDWIEGSSPEWPGNVEAWIKRRASAQAADGYRL